MVLKADASNVDEITYHIDKERVLEGFYLFRLAAWVEDEYKSLYPLIIFYFPFLGLTTIIYAVEHLFSKLKNRLCKENAESQ